MAVTHAYGVEDVMHRTQGCCAGKRRVLRGLRWMPWHPLDTGAGTRVTQRPAGDSKGAGVLLYGWVPCHPVLEGYCDRCVIPELLFDFGPRFAGSSLWPVCRSIASSQPIEPIGRPRLSALRSAE